MGGRPPVPRFLARHRKLLTWILVGVAAVAAGLFLAQDKSTLHVESPLAAGDGRFPAYLATHLNAPLTRGNSYTVLQNGDEIFPPMLDAIGGARERIEFESYIFSGSIGERFTEALLAAARRGVQVRLVLDAFGVSQPPEDLGHLLESSGADLVWFNGLGPWTLDKANYRTHRKLLVVDGVTAFTGGAGVDDQWLGRAQDEDHWRDTQFRVTGPAVAGLEAAFFENWTESGGAPAPFFDPPDRPEGDGAPSVTVWSNASEGASDVKLMYLYAIAAARRTLDIQSPYFILDASMRLALADAGHRGVRVRVLTDGDATDAQSVKHASRAEYAALLEAGDRIFEFQPTMMHAKVMIVDQQLSVIGTANFDNRSLELNDEVEMAVADRELATRLTRAFEHDLKRSKTWSAAEWSRRSFREKLRERFWRLFGEVF